MASGEGDPVRLRLVGAGPHPAEDELAAFVDGRLEIDARRRVVEHLAGCAHCSSMVVEASAPPPKQNRWPPAIVVIAIVALFAGSRTPVRPESWFASLVRVCDALATRAIEGRLTGGFAHRPLHASDADVPIRLRAAASRIHLAGDDPHAAGVASLLVADYDRAIATLGRAPKSARVLADLSAAYQARAKARKHVADYEAALDAAERAWRLQRTPETAWNRAVAISAFHLTEATRRAWGDVLRIEPHAAWRAEAVARRAQLDAPTETDEWARLEPHLQRGTDTRAIDEAIRRFPARALIHFEETLLPAWAAAQLAGRETEASRSLSLGRMMAGSLSATGERIAEDTLSAIDRACRDPETCRALARAHATYANGVALVTQQQQHGRAAVAFEESAKEFARLRSPYAYAARHRLGETHVHGARIADAVRAGQTLLADIASLRYRNLEAHAHRFVGLAVLRTGRLEESIAHYREARRLFGEAKDSVKVGAAEILLADAHEYVGDRDTAMKHRFAALRAMQRSGDSSRLDFSLFEAGSSSSWRGWPYAADFFLAESTRAALQQNDFAVAATSSFWRSSVAASRDDFAAAREHARLASDYATRTTDPGQRALLGVSESHLAPSAENAVEKLTDAIRFSERGKSRAYLPELLRRRALVHEQAGDAAAAEADLRLVVEIAEEMLADDAPVAMRDGFASDIRRDYEELIRLLLARGASDEALAFAERARRGEGEVVASIKAIPASTAAAVIELQRDSIVVWLIARQSVKLFRWRSDVPHASIENAPSPQTLASLYDVLLKNWIAHVPRGADLVILPPPSLTDVPFSALWNRETGRAVIDDHAVSFASNLASLQREPPALAATDSILIVGDPTYRKLSPLPRSRREAETVACFYADPVVLLGEQATAPAVLQHLDRADVLQFGGHATVNEYTPELSSLMLASPAGDDDDARIYVHELLQRRKPMKLVVLSACSTARSRSGGERGTLTIARAFLDGGAQTVVGTLWPVSDDAAALFSTRLHQELARGRSVAHAVRAAQLHVRSKTPNDSTWAAFCVLRGNDANAGG